MLSPELNRLGGDVALRAIIDDFVDRVFADAMIGFYFRHSDQDRIKRLEYEHAMAWLGGPPYSGRPLRPAHAPHRIQGGHFDRRLRLLDQVLEEHGVPPDLRQAWLDHNRSLRDQITGDGPGVCEGDEVPFTPAMPARVLFIGNSYTFYHEMPVTVGSLSGGTIHAQRVAQGGADLKYHWDHTEARARIREGGWTHVVLQELSTGPLHDRRKFEKYARRFAEEARAVHGEPVFFQTWPRRLHHEVYRWPWSGGSPQAMMDLLEERIAAVSETCGGSVVPVGRVWCETLGAHEHLELYDGDGHHSSPLGSYLAACVFYAFFRGRGLPSAAPTLSTITGQPVRVSEGDASLVRDTVIHWT